VLNVPRNSLADVDSPSCRPTSRSRSCDSRPPLRPLGGPVASSMHLAGRSSWVDGAAGRRLPYRRLPEVRLPIARHRDDAAGKDSSARGVDLGVNGPPFTRERARHHSAQRCLSPLVIAEFVTTSTVAVYKVRWCNIEHRPAGGSRRPKRRRPVVGARDVPRADHGQARRGRYRTANLCSPS